jgi:hypothetical protein
MTDMEAQALVGGEPGQGGPVGCLARIAGAVKRGVMTVYFTASDSSTPLVAKVCKSSHRFSFSRR